MGPSFVYMVYTWVLGGLRIPNEGPIPERHRISFAILLIEAAIHYKEAVPAFSGHCHRLGTLY